MPNISVPKHSTGQISHAQTFHAQAFDAHAALAAESCLQVHFDDSFPSDVIGDPPASKDNSNPNRQGENREEADRQAWALYNSASSRTPVRANDRKGHANGGKD
jgi:hypothetical protein